jgi:L-lactate dehydrogenase complex protein LldF
MTVQRPSDYATAAAASIRDQPEVRDAITSATRTFDAHRAYAYAQIEVDEWRRWMEGVKNHLLSNLGGYLVQAEERMVANGIQVHWADTREDALTALDHIVSRHGVDRVVKAKSMLTEELGVNAHLEARGIKVRETDLGEYIIQLLGEPPSHIVGPAIHKSVDDCRSLFHAELGTPEDATPDQLAAAARSALREDFLSADLGISGGNFLVAETGTIALIENEGNIRLSTSVPPVHVAFVGIEKLLPRFDDLSGFLQLTSRAATGQPIGNYVSLLQGPRTPNEVDGPTEVHVILVDCGRSRLLADDTAWEALRCVRCGACLNICPVYRQTGGHPYGWTYSGPIGAILAPGLLGLEEAMPLPYASTMCGACVDVCPVRIPFTDILLHWREQAVAAGLTSASEKLSMKAFATATEHPKLWGLAAAVLRRIPLQRGGRALPVLGDWTGQRDAPRPSPERFSRLWEEGIE